MRVIAKRFVTILALSCALSACQTLAGAGTQARIAPYDAYAEQVLKSALSSSLHRANIDLGPSDPSASSSITVLPPPVGPYETNSVALPIRFDIVLRDGVCYVVRTKTREAFALKDVMCVPLGN